MKTFGKFLKKKKDKGESAAAAKPAAAPKPVKSKSAEKMVSFRLMARFIGDCDCGVPTRIQRIWRTAVLSSNTVALCISCYLHSK